MPATEDDLLEDLLRLGVRPGDVLFVHSSLRSVGPVEGGAPAVVRALERAVAPGGLLLMPSFNLVERERRAETWDPLRTPSTVGTLTEFFRLMTGTFRSDHYSHSVAARGPGAAEFVADHRSQEGYRSPWDLPPWGKTYGTLSPMVRAYDAGGKLLFLGTGHHTSTYIHLVEVILWNEALEADPNAPYPGLDRDRLGEQWDAAGRQQQGAVGQAPCRLIDVREYVDGLAAMVRREPRRWLR